MTDEGLHDVSDERMQAFVDVFRVVVEAESDGDHVQSAFITYGDVMKWAGEVYWPRPFPPRSEDVETALELSRDHIGNTMQTMISAHVGRALPEIDNEELLRY
jgi:hypothetical protein